MKRAQPLCSHSTHGQTLGVTTITVAAKEGWVPQNALAIRTKGQQGIEVRKPRKKARYRPL